MSKVISTPIQVPIHIGEKQRPREGVGLIQLCLVVASELSP